MISPHEYSWTDSGFASGRSHHLHELVIMMHSSFVGQYTCKCSPKMLKRARGLHFCVCINLFYFFKHPPVCMAKLWPRPWTPSGLRGSELESWFRWQSSPPPHSLLSPHPHPHPPLRAPFHSLNIACWVYISDRHGTWTAGSRRSKPERLELV